VAKRPVNQWKWRQTLPGVRLVNAKEADRREKAAQQPHWGEILKKRDERVRRERLAEKRRRRATAAQGRLRTG
jgi:hypothetical protein